MKQTFDISRFFKLLKRQWLDLGKVYLSTFVIILAITVFCYVMGYLSIISNQYNIENQIFSTTFRYPLFIVQSIIFLSLIGNHYFSHFGHKGRVITDIMLPASRIEKFLASVFYTLICGIGALLIVFYLVDMAFILKLRSWYEAKGLSIDGMISSASSEQKFPLILETFLDDLFPFLLAIGTMIVAIYQFGSLAFTRFTYIKITLSTILSLGMLALIWIKMGQWIFNGRIPSEMDQPKINWDINPMQVFTVIIFIISIYVFTLSYLKFKEKEV